MGAVSRPFHSPRLALQLPPTGEKTPTIYLWRDRILMNKKLLTVLFCAFLVAGGCSLLAYRMIGAKMGAGGRSATTRVISAATDLKLGTILTASNLTTTEIAGALPKGAILKPENAIGRGMIADVSQ